RSWLGYNISEARHMPYSYTIDPHQRLILTVAEGILSEAEVFAYCAQLQQDPRFDPTFRNLCDFSQTDRIDLRAEAIWSFASKGIFARTARRALLVRSTVGVGLARMYAILRELADDPGIGVFQEYAAALAWLDDA